MRVIKTENDYGSGVVHNYASILDDGTLRQSQSIARSPIVKEFVGLMPDAHIGRGACIGAAIVTEGGILPAAVGVDIGCGVIAVKTDIREDEIPQEKRGPVLGAIRESVPAGVWQGHSVHTDAWTKFHDEFGDPPTPEERVIERMARQFGTLGSGNHFAEISVDTEGWVWALVHSGSRGPGNLLAQRHINAAVELCKAEGIEVEDRDLSYLPTGTAQFDAYIADMLWAQAYAFNQRRAMAQSLLAALETRVRPFEVVSETNCHHNYSEKLDDVRWLSRKGAINAEEGRPGVIPGSMGAETHIVVGKGEPDSHRTAPHGAGRQRSRGQAKRELDLDEFRKQMEGRTWQDRDAEKLLDEAPEAYKPIDVVMSDAADLVESTAVLRAIINYKGV